MSPIKLISTTFNEVISDLNTDPRTSDAPYFFKAIFAGIFSVLAIRFNILGNQLLLPTSEDRTIAEDILAWQDYRLRSITPAKVEMTITVDASATVASSHTIQKADLVCAAPGTSSTKTEQFEGREDLTIPMGQTVAVFDAWQQKTKTGVSVGVAPGGDLQVFQFPDLNVVVETAQITFDTDTYLPARVAFGENEDSLAEATSTDKVFIFKQRTDGSCFAIFGFVDEDGVQYGKIPTAGVAGTATYAVTDGGNGGNVDANTITSYLGSDGFVLSVNNEAAASGGAAPELLSNAKNVAPLRSQTHNMFWDKNSGESIANAVSGVLKAKVNVTGQNTAEVYIMPFGGGAAPGDLIDTVVNRLVAKSFFNQVDLTGFSVSYVNTPIAFGVKMLTGVDYASNLRYIMFAAAYRSSEVSFYVYSQYVALGFSAIIELINDTYSTLTGYTYTADDSVQLRRILDNVEFNDFESTFGPTDISTAIEAFVTGVDFVTVTQPATILHPSASQIIKPTTITPSQL